MSDIDLRVSKKIAQVINLHNYEHDDLMGLMKGHFSDSEIAAIMEGSFVFNLDDFFFTLGKLELELDEFCADLGGSCGLVPEERSLD